jgi:hypothetical protein
MTGLPKARSIGWRVGFWLAACAGLALLVGYQLSQSFPLAPTVTAAPPGAPQLAPAERSAPPRAPAADAVEQIAARPLFSEGRRPFVPSAVPVADAVAEPSQPGLALELAGIFLTETDQAALLLAAGGVPQWLRKGQLIEGWEILAIEQDRVQLRKGAREQVLQLREDLAVPMTARPIADRRARDDRVEQPADESQPAQE